MSVAGERQRSAWAPLASSERSRSEAVSSLLATMSIKDHFAQRSGDPMARGIRSLLAKKRGGPGRERRETVCLFFAGEKGA